MLHLLLSFIHVFKGAHRCITSRLGMRNQRGGSNLHTFTSHAFRIPEQWRQQPAVPSARDLGQRGRHTGPAWGRLPHTDGHPNHEVRL